MNELAPKLEYLKAEELSNNEIITVEMKNLTYFKVKFCNSSHIHIKILSNKLVTVDIAFYNTWNTATIPKVEIHGSYDTLKTLNLLPVQKFTMILDKKLVALQHSLPPCHKILFARE